MNRAKYAGIVSVLIIIFAIIIIYPRQNDLKSFEALYNQGQYHAARAGLEQALRTDPEWYQARAILAHLELAEGKPVEALEQMMIMERGGWDITPLKIEFETWLNSEQLDPVSARLVLEFVISGRPPWGWLKSSGLELAFQWAPDLVPQYLLRLGEREFRENWPIVSRGWHDAQQFGDWETAWAVAVILDNLSFNIWPSETHSLGTYYRSMVVARMYPDDPQLWTKLQSRYPRDCLAAVGKAASLPPDQGLGWLADWESTNQVTPEAASFYSTWKSLIIQNANQVFTPQLAHVEPGQLLYVALTDAGNQDKFMLILEYLAHFDMAAQLEILKLAVHPQPELVLRDMVGMSLSEDGNHVILMEVNNSLENEAAFMYTIDTGKRAEFPPLPLIWSPDGSRAAVTQWNVLGDETEQKLLIFGNQGELQELKLDTYSTLIGWKSSDSLWISREELGSRHSSVSLHFLNLINGSMSRADDVPDLPPTAVYRAGPGGRIAWFQGQSIGIWDGANVLIMELSNDVSDLHWAPDGTRLLLTMNNRLYTMGFRTGLRALNLPELSQGQRIFGRTREEAFSRYPIDRDSYVPRVLAWRSPDELFLDYPIGNRHSILAIYNVSTEKITMTGVINPKSVAGGRVLVCTSDSKDFWSNGEAVNTNNRNVFIYNLR